MGVVSVLAQQCRPIRAWHLQAGFSLNLELPEGDRFFDDKADILEINGLSESQEFILRPGEEPAPEMLGYLRLINLSGAPPPPHMVANCSCPNLESCCIFALSLQLL